MTKYRDRFKDLDWVDVLETLPIITVGGSGGIGSWTTLFLTRAGFETLIVDYDKIEEHNIGGQLFGRHQVGMYKVKGISETVHSYCPNAILHTVNSEYTDNLSSPIMISAFDNMAARKKFFLDWVEIHSEEECKIYIDGRLSAEGFEIYVVQNTEDIKKYRETLFDDEEVDDLPCTAKQTSHMAAMIASYMVGYLTSYVVNYKREHAVRSIPFSYKYFLPADWRETIYN